MKNEQERNSILFVDDELNWLHFARQILSESGYLVQITQNAKESLQLIQHEYFPFILVDLKKVEQEKEIFRRLAEIQSQRDHSIFVMFPTELTPDKVGEMFTLGAHDCIDKPYEVSKLLEVINTKTNEKFTTGGFLPQQSQEQPSAVLIIEDDPDWRERLQEYLRGEAYHVECAGDYADALQLMKEKQFDVIILDLRLVDHSEDFEGMKLLQFLREEDREIPVIIVSAYGTVEHVKDGFKLYNIYDYLSKQHFDRKKYRQSVQKALSIQDSGR